MTTARTNRMMDSVPIYYQQSTVFESIQQAQADEYDTLEAKTADIKAQFHILTATWGLKYWEEAISQPTILTDSYEVRRSRVLAYWRGIGTFNAAMVKSVVEAYSGAVVDVTFNPAEYKILITFVEPRGVPQSIGDIDASLANIIHAHLGTEYSYTFTTWGEIKALGITRGQLKALGLTWGQLKTYEP